MSVSALTWAFSQKINPAAHKIVLLALANRCNEKLDPWKAFPSISALEEDTSLTRRAIFYALSDLKHRGFIESEGRIGKTNRILVYRLNSANRAPLEAEMVQTVHPLMVQTVHPNGANRAPLHIYGTRKEPEGKIPDCLSSIPNFLPEWQHFRAHRQKKRAPMTAHAEELVLRRLSERPTDAIPALEMAMIRGWTGIKWDWFDRDRSEPKPKRTDHRSCL